MSRQTVDHLRVGLIVLGFVLVVQLVFIIIAKLVGGGQVQPVTIQYVDGQTILDPTPRKTDVHFWITNHTSHEVRVLLDRLELKQGTNRTRVYHSRRAHVQVFVTQGTNKVEVTRPAPRYSLSGVTWTTRPQGVLNGKEDVFYRATSIGFPPETVLRAKFIVVEQLDGIARLERYIKSLPSKISGDTSSSWNPFSTNNSYWKSPINMWVETSPLKAAVLYNDSK